jgi:hypothetical protein
MIANDKTAQLKDCAVFFCCTALEFGENVFD